ncbi:hypothetical protein HO173_004190 [Letharia columbiana]|uniref:Uncharacterized protein n=1 Tax=Letharia columbiana TaxID=112416 RepID=A0A8H6G024_9LECA|nr:uncharacterized protein HO173_004190 [Letharia columbiana]KAF6237989.1 hypothetical protein HO173_004190 [Letharia columbiana]
MEGGKPRGLRITAYSLLEHYRRYGPKQLGEIFMRGGGSYNPNIVNYLREQTPTTDITTINEIGIPIGAKEALNFAFLGFEDFVGRPIIIPKNARKGAIGQTEPGDNYFHI